MAGADPAPVGVSRAGLHPGKRPPDGRGAPRPGAGLYDPSVMPSSMIPAQTGLTGSLGRQTPRDQPSLGRRRRSAASTARTGTASRGNATRRFPTIRRSAASTSCRPRWSTARAAEPAGWPSANASRWSDPFACSEGSDFSRAPAATFGRDGRLHGPMDKGKARSGTDGRIRALAGGGL